MGRPHPVELRQRVVDHMAEGNSHRSTADRFKVLVRFVNGMVKLQASTGGLAPKPQGNGGGRSKLSGLKDWIARRIGETRDLKAAALAAEILITHGVSVRRGSFWSVMRSLCLTHKKRPARRRAEAPRGGRRTPHLDRQAPALHAQATDADRLY
jgi:transposase